VTAKKILTNGAVPPHSIEAEQAVLGALLLDPSRLPGVTVLLGAQDFYLPKHRTIFTALTTLASQGKPCDTITAAEQLERAGQLENAGGLAYLSSVARDTPTAANVLAYADIVRERSLLRQLIRAGTDIAAAVFNNDGETARVLIDRAEQRVSEIAGGTFRREGEADFAARVQSLALPSLRDVRAMTIPPRIPTVGELLYPGAYLVVGRSKIGKSWLLLQLLLAIAEGGTFLGYNIAVRDIEVLAIFGEDNDARIQERLAALGVANAPANTHIINQRKLMELAVQFSTECTFEQFLEVWLASHPKVTAVVVDTETTCRQIWAGERREANQRITETDYKQTRAYDEIALRRGIVIFLVNHAAKRKNGEFFDIHELINRSGTAIAGCSGSIAIADPPDRDPFDTTNRRRVLGIRGRDLKDDVMLAIRQETDMPYFVSEGPYREVKQTEGENEILEALEQDFEPGKFATTRALADAIGKNHSTTKNIVNRMLKMRRTLWKQYRVTVKRGTGGGIKLEPFNAKETRQ
jgi:hypothetical protein